MEIYPHSVPDLSSDSVEMIPSFDPQLSRDSIEVETLHNSGLEWFHWTYYSTEALCTNIRNQTLYPKAKITAKVRVTKTRVGKSRVLTDTPEKDQIEEDYIRKQENQKKSTKAKWAVLPQKEEASKTRTIPVRSDSSTKKTEKPIVRVEFKKSRKSEVQADSSNKENETPAATPAIWNATVNISSTNKVQRTRSGRIVYQNCLVNYGYD